MTKPEYDVIIVGGGPAGIFAALELVKLTGKILIIEKGKNLAERFCHLRTDTSLYFLQTLLDCLRVGGAGASVRWETGPFLL